MRFCPWYPLAQAADLVPAGENVIQLRVAQGLCDYPRGKTAMVHYAHAADARAAAVAFAAAHAARDLWCRHLIELDGERDLAAFHARLLADFVRRFGEAPRAPLPR